MAVGRQEVLDWLDALQRTYSEKRQLLTELDSAIGDADHGINMDRGFSAVKAEIDSVPSDIGSIFQAVATVLIRKVGGASVHCTEHSFSAPVRVREDGAVAGRLCCVQAGIGVRQRARRTGRQTCSMRSACLATMRESQSRWDARTGSPDRRRRPKPGCWRPFDAGPREPGQPPRSEERGTSGSGATSSG
jgi:hypothetical protein